MRWTFLASILFLLPGTPSFAHTEEVVCRDLPTSDEVQCLGEVLEKAEAELQEKYASVRKQFDTGSDEPAVKRRDADRKKQLDLTQKSWQGYVDQTCGLVASMWEDGAARVPSSLRCELRLTQQRTLDLDRLFYQVMKSD